MARLILESGVWKVVDDIEVQTVEFTTIDEGFAINTSGIIWSFNSIYGTGSTSGYASDLTGSYMSYGHIITELDSS
tara:strand:+ start:893 stop:1120 length:228 start_codon:yes stop_codon:yes gene_type:complete